MRARSIKPGICDNELLGTADPFCTLLFERLWMMADREGRLEDRPLRIKAQAFPYREGLDIGPLLNWLTEHGFILRYTVSGTGYIQVRKFTEHQSPHVKEAASKLPAPDSPGASTSAAPEIPAPVALTPSSLTPDSGLLTADSSSLRSHGAARPRLRHAARAVDEPEGFSEVRQSYPKRAGGQRWGDALKFFQRRIREGEKVSVILEGVRRYAEFARATGIERTEKVQQVATFLGDNRGYLELWQPPPRVLSSVEQAKERLRNWNGNGNGDGRVVSEQSGQNEAGMGTAVGMLRRPTGS